MPSPGSIARDRKYAERRAGLAVAVLPLYAQGQGCKLIGRALEINPILVRTILIEQGVYQPGKLKRLTGGPSSRYGWRATITSMRGRVRRCLNKKPRKPPRPISPTQGMTEAQAFRWRYHNIPEQRIYELCRRRMKRVLHGIKKAGKSMDLVGCTTAHLRAHIEAQFKSGMNWMNSGTGKGLWHIDHQIPCASFDLTREDQQRICFHWTNLRPMWSLDNIRKGAKLDAHMTPCLPL